MSKFAKTALVVVAIVVLLVVDGIITSQNGMGIPALLKYILLFGLLGAIPFVRASGDSAKKD